MGLRKTTEKEEKKRPTPPSQMTLSQIDRRLEDFIGSMEFSRQGTSERITRHYDYLLSWARLSASEFKKVHDTYKDRPFGVEIFAGAVVVDEHGGYAVRIPEDDADTPLLPLLYDIIQLLTERRRKIDFIERSLYSS